MRAYLGICKISIRPPSDGAPPGVVIELKNYGSTPAFNVFHKSRKEILLKGKEEFDLSEKDSSSLPDILPGQIVYPVSTGSIKEWPLMLALMNTTQNNLYVFGTIWYEDIFSDLHWTEYRFWLPFEYDGLSECDLVPFKNGNRIDRLHPAEDQPQTTEGGWFGRARLAAGDWIAGRNT
jgi:hypothetical protein